MKKIICEKGDFRDGLSVVVQLENKSPLYRQCGTYLVFNFYEDLKKEGSINLGKSFFVFLSEKQKEIDFAKDYLLSAKGEILKELERKSPDELAVWIRSELTPAVNNFIEDELEKIRVKKEEEKAAKEEQKRLEKEAKRKAAAEKKEAKKVE